MNTHQVQVQRWSQKQIKVVALHAPSPEGESDVQRVLLTIPSDKTSAEITARVLRDLEPASEVKVVPAFCTCHHAMWCAIKEPHLFYECKTENEETARG